MNSIVSELRDVVEGKLRNGFRNLFPFIACKFLFLGFPRPLDKSLNCCTFVVINSICAHVDELKISTF